MFKSAGKTLSVLFAAAAIVGSATVLSGASEPAATATLGKGDRLDIRTNAPKCSEQAWPYYDAACVKGSASPAKAVRIVTSDRIPGTVSR